MWQARLLPFRAASTARAAIIIVIIAAIIIAVAAEPAKARAGKSLIQRQAMPAAGVAGGSRGLRERHGMQMRCIG